eukprot:TRINITY_DN894_c0_g1_i1.p1 TRINITY_DN894_c0_g1~~TRINITY_DN894_c0_g1_i1.p1  ORF type:complete len:442 (+),score=74.40 TRINITY_DN894_c0_g1_i1:23-1348(+)
MEVVLGASSNKGSLCLIDLHRNMTLKQYRQSPPTKKGCVATLGDSYFIITSDLKTTSSGESKTTQNSKVIAWTWGSELVHSHSFVSHQITALVGTNCGNYVIGGSSDGSVIVWNACTGRQLHCFYNLVQPITSMSVSPDDQWLAIGSSDGVINVYRTPLLIAGISDISLYTSFANHTLPITSIIFSLTSNRIYSCSLDQTCKIWNLTASLLLYSISFPTSLTCVALSPVGDCCYVGGNDGNIYKVNLWSLNHKSNDFNILDDVHNMPMIFKGSDTVHCLDVNIDGSLLVSGADDGCIRIWSASTGQLVHSFLQQKGPITCVKVLLKPAHVVTSNTETIPKTLPLLQPLSPLVYIPNNDDTELVKLPYLIVDDPDNGLTDLQSKRLTHQRVEKFINSNVNAGKNNLLEEIEVLKDEISSLKEANTRWKTLNNDMLATSFTNF